MKTVIFSIAIALVIVLSTMMLPQHSGFTVGTFYNHQTQSTYFAKDIYAKGYPASYYIPGGFDYGGNLMYKPFFFNVLIISLFIWVLIKMRCIFLEKKKCKNQKSLE